MAVEGVMSLQGRKAIATAAVILAIACAGRTAVRSQPVEHAFGDDWITLPQPRDQPLLGMAYSLRGTFSENCYSFREQQVRSSDTMALTWNRQTGDTINLKLADLLGLGGAARSTTRGQLSLDSIVILQAIDVSPRPGTCRNLYYNLPRHPAITAVIGAKALRYTSWDERGKSLTADLETKLSKGQFTAGATVRRLSTDTAYVSFSSVRWLGIHLQGFQFKETADSTGTVAPDSIGPFAFGDIFPLGIVAMQARVTRDPSGSYKVETHRLIAGEPWNSAMVNPGETFFLGASSDTLGVSGDYMLARIFPVQGSTDSATITVSQSGYDPSLEWTSNRDTTAAKAWAVRP
jgi:hypothetical protein